MLKTIQKLLVCSSFFLISCESVEGQRTVAEVQKSMEMTHFHIPKLPDSMSFAGEKIDLTDWDLRERLDRELHAIVFYHNLIIPNLKRSTRFFPAMETWLRSANLPADFKYLAVVESGLENVTSPSGAQGFWQFMPTTAKEYGMTINENIDERNDLAKSTLAAAQYLIRAKDSLGSWLDAAAAYNRGLAGFKKDKKWQRSNVFFDTYLNGETSRYVFRILAMKLIFEQPEAYGYDISAIEMYLPYSTVERKVESGIENLAIWSKDQGINYKILIKLNPWIISNTLPKRAGGYVLLLPKDESQLRNLKN